MKFGVKLGLCILVAQLTAIPGFSQEPDSAAAPEMASAEAYALGDLALTDFKTGNDPLQQLKHFFADSKLPLSSAQERQLKTNISSTLGNMQGAQDETAIRKANQDFNRNLFSILTPSQKAVLTRYRNEQIMLRGGVPALTLIMQNAQTPLTADQQQQIAALYKDFAQSAAQLSHTPNATDRAQLDKLENDSLLKVVKLLTPAQRRSLAASHLGALNSTLKLQQ